jgi:RNase H-fold protein (predicted Holliday junction resolvase)
VLVICETKNKRIRRFIITEYQDKYDTFQLLRKENESTGGITIITKKSLNAQLHGTDLKEIISIRIQINERVLFVIGCYRSSKPGKKRRTQNEEIEGRINTLMRKYTRTNIVLAVDLNMKLLNKYANAKHPKYEKEFQETLNKHFKFETERKITKTETKKSLDHILISQPNQEKTEMIKGFENLSDHTSITTFITVLSSKRKYKWKIDKMRIKE